LETPTGIHTKRLDAIGFRLMMLLTLTTDKSTIDLETIERVIAILNYERAIRILTDAIDCEGIVAKLEEGIRRHLKVGVMNERELRQRVHADRCGLWAFRSALENLVKADDIRCEAAGYALLSQPSSAL
jgi:hypothetical protein